MSEKAPAAGASGVPEASAEARVDRRVGRAIDGQGAVPRLVRLVFRGASGGQQARRCQ